MRGKIKMKRKYRYNNRNTTNGINCRTKQVKNLLLCALARICDKLYLCGMEQCPLNNVLVIDEIPLIAVGLQEVFRSLHPSIKVGFFENIYSALGTPGPEGRVFDLIVLGSWPEDAFSHLYPSIAGLKEKFGASRVMLYTTLYDYTIIEKMAECGIDAYVHKFEPVDEVVNAYRRLAAGAPYISGMLQTLFYDYGQGVRK